VAKGAHQRVGNRVFSPKIAKSGLAGEVYIAATAGNHGLSIAAGARIFGARAMIYVGRRG